MKHLIDGAACDVDECAAGFAAVAEDAPGEADGALGAGVADAAEPAAGIISAGHEGGNERDAEAALNQSGDGCELGAFEDGATGDTVFPAEAGHLFSKAVFAAEDKKLLLFEAAPLNGLFFCKAVSLRDDGDQFFMGYGLDVDTGAFMEDGGECNIEFADFQHLHDAVCDGFEDMDLYAGELNSEGFYEMGQDEGANCGDGADAEDAVYLATEFADFRFYAVEFGEDPAGGFDQQGAGFGGNDFSGQAIKQGVADFIFKALYPEAEGGL